MPDTIPPLSITHILLIACAGLYAGIQNTLAGGGSFITFPALMLAGIPPISANISSTLALFPAQISSWWAGKHMAQGLETISLKQLCYISLIGGIIGALLLLSTPTHIFTRLVPWFVLFATLIFGWGSFGKKSSPNQIDKQKSPAKLWIAQFMIAIYGGYFGAGIGILMLATLTLAGQPIKTATTTKNLLAMLMNLSAVLTFFTSKHAVWPAIAALSIGALFGSVIGGWLMHKVSERYLRLFVILVGSTLSIWLFNR